MNKPESGLLDELSVRRYVPRKWRTFYYTILDRLKYSAETPPEHQIIADGIAYCYLQLAIGREIMLSILSNKAPARDRAEPPDLGSIEKRLLQWLAAWREFGKKNDGPADLSKIMVEAEAELEMPVAELPVAEAEGSEAEPS